MLDGALASTWQFLEAEGQPACVLHLDPKPHGEYRPDHQYHIIALSTTATTKALLPTKNFDAVLHDTKGAAQCRAVIHKVHDAIVLGQLLAHWNGLSSKDRLGNGEGGQLAIGVGGVVPALDVGRAAAGDHLGLALGSGRHDHVEVWRLAGTLGARGWRGEGGCRRDGGARIWNRSRVERST